MTESEWCGADDPAPMLGFLAGRWSRRLRRLFAVACCRRIQDVIPDERWRRALASVERFAEGGDRAERLAVRDAWRAVERERRPAAVHAAWMALLRPAQASRLTVWAAGLAVEVAAAGVMRSRLVYEGAQALAALPPELVPTAWQGLAVPSWYLITAERAWARRQREEREAAERRAQCGLLRELVGNPFRRPDVDPAWLSQADGVALRVANAIAESQAFEQLPILADALEDAGCADADLLGHLRGPGPHLPGCWALDLLLGRD